jgi:hypothetical protein
LNQVKGLLGDAMRLSARDPTARTSISKAAQSFVQFLQLANEARTKAAAGDVAGAIQLGQTQEADGGETPMTATTTALGAILSGDEAAFNAIVTSTDRGTTTLPFLLAAALFGTVMLAGFGLWQRYTEYR